MADHRLSLAVNGRENQLHTRLVSFEMAGSVLGTGSVAIVGLGYVGLPTAVELHGKSPRIIGIDVSERRLGDIASREADLTEADQERLAAALADGSLELTTDPAAAGAAEAVIICVPTPVDGNQTPDLTALRAACASVVQYAVPGQVIILTSTSYVGTTREMLTEPLRQRGMTVGTDINVAFSPERIDPGNATHLQSETPRVVGGATGGMHQPGRRDHRPGHRLGVPGQLDRRRRGHQALREHLPRRVPGPGQRVRRRVRRARPGPDRGHAGRGHQAVRLPGRVPRARRGRSLHSLRPALPALAAERAGPCLAADRAGHEVHRDAPGTGDRAGGRGDGRRGPPAGRRARHRDRRQLQGRRPGPARVPGPAASSTG